MLEVVFSPLEVAQPYSLLTPALVVQEGARGTARVLLLQGAAACAAAA